MRQRFALVAIKKNNVPRFGLLFAQLQAQADPFDLAGDLASLQRVSRSPPTELFFRNALDNCERLMRTPSRASISARRREIVQLCRSAAGCSKQTAITRSAVSLFTGGGPGCHVSLSVSSIPPSAKSLRQRRTVSWPHAERLGDPRAGPAGQREQHGACPVRLAAITRAAQRHKGGALFVGCRERRLSLQPYTLQIGAGSESQKTYPLVSQTESGG